jgi:chromosomal replication initiator protein
MELKGLQERLLSRFQSSLTVDIQPPDLETRIAILNKKATADGLDLPYDVIEFIAQNVKSNIRELEGFLIRMLAYSSLMQVDIELEMARKIFRETGAVEKKGIVSIEDIQKIVGTSYSINLDSLVGKSRTKEVAEARMVAMYLAREYTNLSLKTIGIYFGGRDHSTVVHACKCVEDKKTENKQFSVRVVSVQEKVRNAI